MDNEMIERVIKASFDCWNKKRGLSYTVADLNEDEKEFAVEHAKEIIKAIREPTNKMLEAGFDNTNAISSKMVYQSMIDVIINE